MDNTFSFGSIRTKANQKAEIILGFNKTNGLTDEQVKLSADKYGKNSFTVQKKKSFFKSFLENLSDPIIRVLIGAMFINILFTYKNINYVEIVGIGITVFIAAFVSTVSEYSSNAAYEKLFCEMNDVSYRIRRGGNTKSIPIGKIVKYDIVELSQGEIIPADGFLIEGTLECDQAPLTGESAPVAKKSINVTKLTDTYIENFDNCRTDNINFLSRGCAVISGEGSMAVSAVGDNTMYGSIGSEIQNENSDSPLKDRLTSLARSISKLGYVAAFLVAMISLFNDFVISNDFNTALILESLSDFKTVGKQLIHALTLAVSIVVVAVPEGLPMMITVVLSANMKKMMKNGLLVRRLVGIETAGNISILFTDKTGTITDGNMRVVGLDDGKGTILDKTSVNKDIEILRVMRLGAEFCAGNGGGNQTDKAINTFLSTRRNSDYRCVEKIPFSSKTKFAAALIENTITNECLTIVRGATEILEKMCKNKPQFTDKFSEGLRELSVIKGDEDSFYNLKRGKFTQNFDFVCKVIIKDSIREKIPEAVRECHTAGIQVVMITGDSEKTATSIAQDVGIIKGKHALYRHNCEIEYGISYVLNADILHKIDDTELKRVLPYISVISRAEPSDKSRLIKVSRELGHIVGMTGDGVNDAPALKNADVGFAMGSGTEAAREASDIVISDNNFASIVKAVLYGRTIFASIRKFILFQLTMNLCAVGISILAPLIGIENPITIPQMLWINIIMDTLGSLAFAGEAPRKFYMRMPPLKRSEKILDKSTVIRIISMGTFSLLVGLCFLSSESLKGMTKNLSENYCLTVFFALFVFSGIANSFCARCSDRNLFTGLRQNKMFLLIMGTVSVIQLALIYFGGDVFRTVPLHKHDILFAALLSAGVFPADIIVKSFLRKRRR